MRQLVFQSASGPVILVREDFANMSEDTLRLFGSWISSEKMSRYWRTHDVRKNPRPRDLARMEINETIFWPKRKRVFDREKKVARQILRKESADWSARITLEGVKITRIA